MSLRFFGPRLSKGGVSSRKTIRLTRTFDATLTWECAKVDGGGGVTLIANQRKSRGTLSRKVQARAQWAGTANRYYIQVIDENGVTHTAITNSGIPGFPALASGHATISQYVSTKTFAGSSDFTGTQTLFPSPGWAFFRGGRG